MPDEQRGVGRVRGRLEQFRPDQRGTYLTVRYDDLEEALDTLATKQAECERLREALSDAVAVIEKMANGATRKECSPELDRVVVFMNALKDADA
jgi:hypothetical protein